MTVHRVSVANALQLQTKHWRIGWATYAAYAPDAARWKTIAT